MAKETDLNLTSDKALCIKASMGATVTDSGIDVQPLEKHTDDRVAVTKDAKLKEHARNKTDSKHKR